MIQVNLRVVLAQRRQDTGDQETYEQMASAMGISTSTISRLATGRTSRIDLSTLNALCKYLGCTPGDILIYVPEDAGDESEGGDDEGDLVALS